MNEPKYSKEQTTSIMEMLGRFMNATGASQAKVARLAGLQASQLSQLLNGHYSGDHDKQLRAVAQFLGRQAEAANAPSLRKFAETGPAKSVLSCCRQNHIHGTIGLVIGNSGKGKTMAFAEYARRESNVYRISGAQWITTPRQLCLTIASRMLSDRRYNTFQDLARALIEELAGSNALLIVDQAHQLSERGLEFIQNLWDEVNEAGVAAEGESARNRFGIVLGGTKRLRSTIENEQSTYLYEQLRGRIYGGFTAILNVAFTLEDLQAIVTNAQLEYPLSPDAMTWLLRAANSAHGLRAAVGYLEKAEEIAKRKLTTPGVPLTADALEHVKPFTLAA